MLSVDSLFADALHHHQAGLLNDAELLYHQVLSLDACHADSLHLLGVIAYQTKRHVLAISYITKATTVSPDAASYYSNLGNAFKDLGRLDEAVTSYRKAAGIEPDYAEAQNNMGLALQDGNRLISAIDCYLRALVLRPDYPGALNNLGLARQKQGALGQAAISYKWALALKRDFAVAHNNLGLVLHDLGRPDEAISAFQRALDAAPDYTSAHSNLLMTLHYSARYSNADILALSRRFAPQQERSRPQQDFRNTRDPHRQLRIGYVSADFRTHPVGYFLARVLTSHDRTNIAIICYSNASEVDGMTTLLRDSVDEWRSIVGISDADAAAMIEKDGIDILVDLSGHSAKNRLPLFAARPAPIQATWLGFFGTTGLSSIDYILADRLVAPRDEDIYFSETVWRLPNCYLCYSPPPFDIPIGPWPSTAEGFVTFGCFNNRSKISAETVAVWAAILKRVERSRLFLKTKSLADADCRARLLAEFADNGIGEERLILEGHSPRAEALAAYNRVDIALDPFPFGGGTTTAETLWMGVPLVTLQGTRWAGRMSQSIMTTINLNDWVAEDLDQYVEIACKLAADIPHIAHLRPNLRRRLEDSAFCDGPGFASSLEAAFRGMWSNWCSKEH